MLINKIFKNRRFQSFKILKRLITLIFLKSGLKTLFESLTR